MSEQASNLPAAPGPGAAVSPASTTAVQAPAAAPETTVVPRQDSRPRRRVRRRVPVVGDSDHSFEAVQHKLQVVIEAMAAANGHLEGLDRRKRATATEASNLASGIADAELDEVFVEMTQEVATAEGEAAKAVRAMLRAAQLAEKSAIEVKRAHARHYGALHRVRKGRKWRTPKPGFFRR
ncbi:conjugal transfer protein TraB [Kitasatospora sp. NPDC048296]|uniref:conjugal transfer protein TraB n=1 Tax=Kitasatospora sp. NPDC048296 TaxID=3364048 RepID=UPI00371C5F79